MLQKVAIVMRNPEAVTFFCIAVLMGYGMGTIDSFLFLYLDELGAGSAESCDVIMHDCAVHDLAGVAGSRRCL